MLSYDKSIYVRHFAYLGYAIIAPDFSIDGAQYESPCISIIRYTDCRSRYTYKCLQQYACFTHRDHGQSHAALDHPANQSAYRHPHPDADVQRAAFANAGPAYHGDLSA